MFLLTIAMMTLNLLDLAALSLIGLLIAFLTDGSGLGFSSILSGLTPTAAVLYLLGVRDCFLLSRRWVVFFSRKCGHDSLLEWRFTSPVK